MAGSSKDIKVRFVRISTELFDNGNTDTAFILCGTEDSGRPT